MSSERQLLESESRWWGEHVHRYDEAIKYVSPGDTILDIACGTGFGTAMLAERSSGQVVGGDISEEAIDQCREQWKGSNIEFRKLDATKLEFEPAYFDIIVSFETIEHIKEYGKMAAEFRRVLKPGGRLILSTPNKNITSPDGSIRNRFHVQEFRLKELTGILEKEFSDVKITGQYYHRYERPSLKRRIGFLFEKGFLSFGIRKIPFTFRNRFMEFIFGYPLYPVASDFRLEADPDRIERLCPVLFAVCIRK